MSGKMIMDKTWEKIQTKTFTKWVNSHLVKSGKEWQIENLQTDFADGLKFIKFLENISGKKITQYEKKPRMRIHKVSNCDRCMTFLKSEDIRLVGIGAENIVDGNMTLILGMIWTIICQYQIADISDEELAGKEALLLWCKKKTKGYAGVDPNPGLTNFHDSWKNGLAFCALIHKHRPDLLDYSKCSPDTPHENLKYAFEVAERDLGIPSLLDVEDVADVDRPDERSIITQVVQYYHVFSKSQKGEVAGRRVGKLVDLQRQIDEMKHDYVERAGKLVSWCDDKVAWLQEPIPSGEDELAQRLKDLATYRTEEKPPRAAERFALEGLFNTLQVKLSSNNRDPFVAPERLSPEEIEELWRKLLEAERDREQALRDARANARQLGLFGARFDDKAGRLEEWIKRSQEYLGKDENVDSVVAAQSKLDELGAWSAEYDDNKPRVEQVKLIADEMHKLDPALGEAKQQRAAAVREAFDGLSPEHQRKQADLEAKLAREKEKEQVRLDFAKAAKEYVNWCRDRRALVKDDRYFGESVEAVEADGQRLDGADKETTDESATRRQAAEALWQRSQELGIGENKYTPLTGDDLAAAAASVDTALGERREAWQKALDDERAKEEKRKEFAAAAQAFVDACAARKAHIDGMEGDPQSLIAGIGEYHADGAPEKEHLDKLAALQQELSALGVTSNKHTPYNMQGLRNEDGKLRAFVKNRVAALEEEQALKHDYERRAGELLAWVEGQVGDTLANRDAANTLEDAQERMAQFSVYQTAEKPNRSNAKYALEKLHEQINDLLAANARPAYEPPAAMTTEAVNAAWQGLEEAEGKRREWLRGYLSRQEELAVLVKRFNSDAGDLEQWTAGKKEYLTAEPKVDSLYSAQYELVIFDTFQEEAQSRKGRLAQLGELKGRIRELEYGKADEVDARFAALEEGFAALDTDGAALKDKLAGLLAAQKGHEDTRMAWAARSKDFARWCKAQAEEVALTDFGYTLDTVVAAGDKLTGHEDTVRAESEAKRGELADLWKQMGDAGITAAPHSETTDGDVQGHQDALAAALAERRSQYDAELARQQAWDAKRKEFADGANEFVAWLKEQRAAVDAARPDADAIEGVFQKGEPGAAKIAALQTLAEGMQADGVVGNDYTGLSVPLLQARHDQYAEFVRVALEAIGEEKAFEERAAKILAETEAAQKREQEQFEFVKRAKLLLNWLDGVSALLAEPISATSVENVKALEDELTQMRAAVNAKEPEFKELQALSGAGVSETPRTSKEAGGGKGLMHEVEQAWFRTRKQADDRQGALAAERGQQAANDKLCKAFADAAGAFQDWILGQKSTLTGTSGDLEKQLADLHALQASNEEGRPKLEAVVALGGELLSAGVEQNPHTQLTDSQLKLEYEQLVDATKQKTAVIEKEMFAKAGSDVSPEQIAEFKEVFTHFDKSGDSQLQPFELKACLSSLGDDPSDEELAGLMSKYGDGQKIGFAQFIDLMVARTKDTDSAEAILESFTIIAGGKEFVTESDMRSCMSGEQVDFLVKVMPKLSEDEPVTYDFKKYVADAY